MQHCRDRLLAMKRDEHRKALIAQCEEDEAASESDARREEGGSASRIERTAGRAAKADFPARYRGTSFRSASTTTRARRQRAPS